MQHLFLNSSADLVSTANHLFPVLGVKYSARHSKNVLNGVYYEGYCFGCRIRLEENSYEFEDQFKYMLTVKCNLLSETTMRDDDVPVLTQLLQRVLSDNLKIKIELEDDLQSNGP